MEVNPCYLACELYYLQIEGLDFELVQTSQWGGKGHNNGISALGAL